MKYNPSEVTTDQIFDLNWLLEHAELIGSRGLNVDNSQSDYDFLLLVDEGNMDTYDNDCKGMNQSNPYNEHYKFTPLMSNYMDYYPPLNNTALVRYSSSLCEVGKLKVDVIMMTKSDDYKVLKDAYDTMKMLPKVLVENKNDRIDILGKLLKSSNWINAW